MTVSLGTVIGFQNPEVWRRPWPEVYESSLRFAVLAEQLGLDRIWLTEHHFADDGYSQHCSRSRQRSPRVPIVSGSARG